MDGHSSRGMCRMPQPSRANREPRDRVMWATWGCPTVSRAMSWQCLHAEGYGYPQPGPAPRGILAHSLQRFLITSDGVRYGNESFG